MTAKGEVTVFCFPNGQTAVTGDTGEQIPEAQQPWIFVIADHLEKAGIDPVKAEVRLPEGRQGRFFRLDDGTLNWRITL